MGQLESASLLNFGSHSSRATQTLLLYLVPTTQVVSATLVVERSEPGYALKVQRPVYFISEVLTKTKARYPQVQKLLYAVLMATKKL